MRDLNPTYPDQVAECWECLDQGCEHCGQEPLLPWFILADLEFDAELAAAESRAEMGLEFD